MKFFNAILIATFVLSHLFVVNAQEKHALLISVAKYPEEGGWSKLASDRDLIYMKAVLARQGFPAQNIKTLIDEQVTAEGLSVAFSELTGKVRPGDIVLIHCSSHGEQVEDDNRDEVDGLDETIVLYHAIAPSHSTDFKKDQAGYFRDDQLGRYIKQLRMKLGTAGDILVILDACHSGSGTRGALTVRGGQPPLVSPAYKHGLFIRPDTASAFGDILLPDHPGSGLAGYVIFSATRPDEVSFEITDEDNKPVGPLTYALARTLENCREGFTYRALFSAIACRMNLKSPLQHPVAEGNGMDRQLFGGRFVVQKPYLEIQETADSMVTVNGGKFYGLDKGAEVTIHREGTQDPLGSIPLARGIVMHASLMTSTIRLNKSVTGAVPTSSWVFLDEPVFNIEPVSVHLEKQGRLLFDSLEEEKLKVLISGLPLLKWDDKPQLTIVKGEDVDTIRINAGGYIFDTVRSGANHYDQLLRKLQRYASYKFLKEIEVNDAAYAADVNLIPVINGKLDSAAVNNKLLHGSYVFHEGDQFAILFTNKTRKPLYLNILDLQPDGHINPILPHKNNLVYPSDLKVNAGESRLFKPFTIAPPYGMEILKVFVSRKQIDMEEMVIGSGKQERGNLSMIEKLFSRSFNNSTRADAVGKAGPADGIAFNVLLEIRKKQ
jgi:hypothetical protein